MITESLIKEGNNLANYLDAILCVENPAELMTQPDMREYMGSAIRQWRQAANQADDCLEHAMELAATQQPEGVAA